VVVVGVVSLEQPRSRFSFDLIAVTVTQKQSDDARPCRSASLSGFQSVLDAFFAQSGLPFANVLSAERIERVFAKHDTVKNQTAYLNRQFRIRVWDSRSLELLRFSRWRRLP